MAPVDDDSQDGFLYSWYIGLKFHILTGMFKKKNPGGLFVLCEAVKTFSSLNKELANVCTADSSDAS